MKLFTAVYNDAQLFGHFLKYYRAAGVGRFFIASAPEFAVEIERMGKFYPIQVFKDLDVGSSLLTGTEAISAMRHHHQGSDEWSLIVDLDEFIEFAEPVDVIAAKAAGEGADAVRGLLYDRFSADGRLAPVDPEMALSQIFPVKSRFIRYVMQGCDHKTVLVRGHLAPVPGRGHHLFEDERLYSKLLEISHYKWTAGAIERLRASHRRVVAAGLPWEIEYRRALDHYDRHGRFAWETFGGRLSEDFVPVVPERCADCPAPVSEAEHEYSIRQFGRPLCRLHQKQPERAAGAGGFTGT
jgi:hypothetical protein